METSEILLWFFNGNFRNFALILQCKLCDLGMAELRLIAINNY